MKFENMSEEMRLLAAKALSEALPALVCPIIDSGQYTEATKKAEETAKIIRLAFNALVS